MCHSHIIETYFVIKWFEYYQRSYFSCTQKRSLLKLDIIHYAKYLNILCDKSIIWILWVIKMYIYNLHDCLKTFLMVVTIVLLRRNSWTMILSKKWEVISFNFQCVEVILHCAIKKPFSLCDSVPPNRQILGYLSTWQYSQPIFVSFTLHNYSRKGLERKGIKKNRPLRK